MSQLSAMPVSRRLVCVFPDARAILESYIDALLSLCQDGSLEITDREYDGEGRVSSLTLRSAGDIAMSVDRLQAGMVEQPPRGQDMQYRTLGKTGIRVSALGFGAMRLPMAGQQVDYEAAVPLLRRGLELGINYIDSANTYSNGTNEVAVGRAIQGWPREKILLSTKQTISSADEALRWRSRLDVQLRRFDTPFIDIYNCHALTWEQFQTYVSPKGGVLDQARKAQAEGLIRHLSLSCHDTPENMRKLIGTREFASITLQYNLLDRVNAGVIAFAHECGVGVAVMGPVGGGRLALSTEMLRRYSSSYRESKSTPEIALRFVLSNPGVSVALSGMTTIRQIEENTVTASRAEPLSPAEFQQIDEALGQIKKLEDLYCTGCGYCMPCPNAVKIPDNFQLMNYYRLYQAEGFARSRYVFLAAPGQGAASQCIECRECEPKCPQNVPIPERLREVAAALG